VADINSPSMGFFPALSALERVQHLVTAIESGPGFLFARERRRVLDIADDASVAELQFGREVELPRA
jgi:hypothetical protein